MEEPFESTPARITSLEERQAQLESRIAALEKQATEQMKRTVPWTWPSTWPDYPTPAYPQIPLDEARCPVCLGLYKDMTGYVCNHPQCPSRVTYVAGTTWYNDPHAVSQTPVKMSAETPEHLKGIHGYFPIP